MKEIYSKKLNRPVKLDVYLSEDGLNVITATSLRQVFESIKEDRGIKESIQWDAKFDNDGRFYYAGATYRLTDKAGYDSVFVGESSPETLLTDISRKYPGQMAVNRAMAEGILSYLQLDIAGRAFADIQVPDRTLEKADIGDVPQMNEEMTIPAENFEGGDGSSATDNNKGKSDSEAGSPTKSDKNDNSNVNSESVAEENINNKSNINDDSIIKFGPYAGKTVRELFAALDSDVKAQRTVDIAKRRLNLPTEYDRQVFAYIADKAAARG